MTQQVRQRRLTAVKTADAINKIEGAPVSKNARHLSDQWVRGEITGAEMKAMIVSTHKQPAVKER